MAATSRFWHGRRLWAAHRSCHTECVPTPERYSARVGARGRVVLPKGVRERLRLQEGDRLVLTVEPDGEVRLASARQIAERFRGFLKDEFPGRSLADELIAERREEARREDG